MPSLAPTSVQQRAEALRASTKRTSAPCLSRSGQPAYAGTPTAVATPGTTSKGIAGGGADEHFLGRVAVEPGVARDGTHDPPAGACGLHDKIGRVPDHRDPGGC